MLLKYSMSWARLITFAWTHGRREQRPYHAGLSIRREVVRHTGLDGVGSQVKDGTIHVARVRHCGLWNAS